MPNDIQELRQHLFDTIKAVTRKDDPLPVDRAKVVADLSQTIINSARVEVDLIAALGRDNVVPSGFLPSSKALPAPGNPPKPALEHHTTGQGVPPQGPRAAL